MPYNTALEKRLESLIEQPERLEKKKMFGGICYLLKGRMAFGIHKQAFIVRTAPEKVEEWLKNGSALLFDITGHAMKGWALFPPQKIEDDRRLAELVNLCLDYVKTLPEK